MEHHQIESAELVDTVDGIEIYHQCPEQGGDGTYAITTDAISIGSMDRILVADPFALRVLADKMETHLARTQERTPATPEGADGQPAGD